MARRPSNFNNFVGQTRWVKFTKRLIEGAQVREKAAPHLLITAGNGMGKTAFATAVACEIGTKVAFIRAKKGTKPEHLSQILVSLRASDIFIIDEAHNLKPEAQELLLQAIDFQLIPLGPHSDDLHSIADCTVVLVTSYPGKLLPALDARVQTVELEQYRDRELREIARLTAEELGLEITGQACTLLSSSSQGSPSLLLKNLEFVRLLHPTATKLSSDHVRDLLTEQGIDEKSGLSALQLSYLTALHQFPGGQASLRALAHALGGRDEKHLDRVCERFLEQDGLINRTGSKRELTDKGELIALSALAAPSPEETPTETDEGKKVA